MEYYFCLDFLYIIFLLIYSYLFTYSKTLFISLHFAKTRMKIDQVRAGLQLPKRCGGQNQKLQKLHFQEAELP